MRVGDRVRITAKHAGPDRNERGVITKARGLAEWYVRLDKGGRQMSWRESSMELTSTAHERAIQLLEVLGGEEYFA